MYGIRFPRAFDYFSGPGRCPTGLARDRDSSLDVIATHGGALDHSTANPTWSDIFECRFKARSSKLERLFSLKRGKRDVGALSFELLKVSPQVGLAVMDCYYRQRLDY